MSTLRLRVEARQPLKRFSLSEVPEFIRHRAANRDAIVHGKADGLWGPILLDYVIEAKRAAMYPSEDPVHYVSQEAWDAMVAEAERMEKSGSAKNWLPQPLDPPEPKRRRTKVWKAERAA